MLFDDYENFIIDYSKIPLDVARNHNVASNNLYDENSFVGIWLDYSEWSDKEYLKFKKGIYELVKLSKKEVLGFGLGIIAARLIDLFFCIDPQEISLYFQDIDEDFGKYCPEISDRIEDLKFLIMTMNAKNACDENLPYLKNISKDTAKEEKIFRYKNKEIRKIYYNIHSHFRIENTYCFNMGIAKFLDNSYRNPFICDKKGITHKVFLITYASYCKSEKILNKISLIGAKGKMIYKNPVRKNRVYILEFDFMHEGILEAWFLNISKNHLFYMGLPFDFNYEVFDNIFDLYGCVNIVALKEMLKKNSGILMDYKDKKNKQILELKFYYESNYLRICEE